MKLLGNEGALRGLRPLLCPRQRPSGGPCSRSVLSAVLKETRPPCSPGSGVSAPTRSFQPVASASSHKHQVYHCPVAGVPDRDRSPWRTGQNLRADAHNVSK